MTDLEKLSPSELIAQFVLEHKGQGQFLPYADYEIIKEWLEASTDSDQLLLLLDEQLPEYFNRPGKTPPRSLRGIHKKVLKKIKESNLR